MISIFAYVSYLVSKYYRRGKEMIDYNNLLENTDDDIKIKLLRGWSFSKKDDKISHVPRAIIENDSDFDEFISKNSIKYFVFRWRAPQMGILATARNVILANEWASRHGLVPYNDFEWGYTYESNMLGKDNFYDYIFEQNTTIEDVWNNNIICGDINWEYSHDLKLRKEILGNDIDTRPNCMERDYKVYYATLKKYSDKWLHMRKDILDGAAIKIEEAHNAGKRVLGMAVREGFMLDESRLSKDNQFLYHPHEPNVKEIIEDVTKYKNDNGFDCIYVTAETKETIDLLKCTFGDDFIYTVKERPCLEDYFQSSISFHESNLERNAKKYYDFINSNTKEAKTINTFEKRRMVDYVREIIALSACDCYMGGKSGGTIMACIWNGGKYESISFWTDSHNSKLY